MASESKVIDGLEEEVICVFCFSIKIVYIVYIIISTPTCRWRNNEQVLHA